MDHITYLTLKIVTSLSMSDSDCAWFLLGLLGQSLSMFPFIDKCFENKYLEAWVKVQSFQNPDLLKFKSSLKISRFSSFNCQLPLDTLKIIQKIYYNLLNSGFRG